jgi:hypothetical protein
MVSSQPGWSASQLTEIGALYHHVHIYPSIVGMTYHERNVLQRMERVLEGRL